MPAAIKAAKTVIAQINASMPRTLGSAFVHVDDIDLAVEVDIPPYVRPLPPVGDVEIRIGEQIAEMVPDGATIQMGIGAIPSAVAAALKGKRDLGIHTEMMTDVVLDLVEAGIVTGAHKEINRDRVVATFMLGTERLYRWSDDNPMVEMRSAEYTNDTSVIRRFKRMVAINSAIEIDLTGQVCADSIGRRMYSGVGGQMDFIRGAALAEDGPTDHLPAFDRCGRHGVADRGFPARRRRSGDNACPRLDDRDRVGSRGATRALAARAGPGPHQDRASAIPRRVGKRGAAGEIDLTRRAAIHGGLSITPSRLPRSVPGRSTATRGRRRSARSESRT
jgi:hypothetical protein